MTTVVIKGFGPHVRFKTAAQSEKSSVRVVTNSTVTRVPLVTSTTDVTFQNVA